MSQPAIMATSLVKTFTLSKAIDNVNLSVPSDSIYCLLGANGSGKTTLIKLLAGLVKPTYGSLSILGMSFAHNRKAILARTGVVCDARLIQSMTGRELIRFASSYYPMWSNTMAIRYSELLAVPLHVRFYKLSRGVQRRFWLVLALSQQPDLLILDEPLSGLDPSIADEVLRILVGDFMKEGRTIFMSSNQVSDVERVADQIGVLDTGRLILSSNADDLRASFRNIRVVGNQLPVLNTTSIVSSRQDHNTTEYIVSNDADKLKSFFHSQGAVIISDLPMTIHDIYMAVTSKEKVCTSGKRGLAQG